MANKIVQLKTHNNSDNLFPVTSTKAVYDDENRTIEERLAGTVSLPIGAIFMSAFPIADPAFHLCDGQVLQHSGLYEDFVEFMSQKAVDSGAIISGSGSSAEYTGVNWLARTSEYNSEITKYGQCAKFVINSYNGTVRLPTLTKLIQPTIKESELDSNVEAGLPNITGAVTSGSYNLSEANVNGAFYQLSTYTGSSPNGGGQTLNVAFNASLSNALYGNSDTVQPQVTKMFFYVVVGNSIKTPVNVNYDNVKTEVANIQTQVQAVTNGQLSTTGFGEIAKGILSTEGTIKAYNNTKKTTLRTTVAGGTYWKIPGTRMFFGYAYFVPTTDVSSNDMLEFYIEDSELAKTSYEQTLKNWCVVQGSMLNRSGSSHDRENFTNYMFAKSGGHTWVTQDTDMSTKLNATYNNTIGFFQFILNGYNHNGFRWFIFGTY